MNVEVRPRKPWSAYQICRRTTAAYSPGADEPVVFAEFVVSNSETPHGSCALAPQLTVQVCDNGMTITEDALR